jgi:hypothetical protein
VVTGNPYGVAPDSLPFKGKTTMQSKFMFYENFLRAIEYLPEEDQGKACLALCHFGITGVLPDDPVLKMFCVGVSASVQKYQGRGGKRDGAGRKPQKSKEFLTVEDNQNNQNNQNEQTETINRNININRNFKPKTETETEVEIKTQIYSPEFEELWKLYKPSSTSDGHISPKGAKPDAYKAYCKAQKQADAETIKTGVLVYLQSCKETDTYTSHLSTCLNKGYWVIDENDLSLQRKKQQVEIENRILKNQLENEKQNV